MRLGDLAWTAVDALLRDTRPVVALLPLGAVEAHGPHLPLETDVIISASLADRVSSELAKESVAHVVLPALSYAPAQYAEAFAGTISISSATALALLVDLAASLQRQGFAALALINSHFDPANVAMLREAARRIEGAGLKVAFADFTRRTLASSLTAEFISGACHAGAFETSLVLAARPDLVNETERANLPDNPSSLTEAFARGAKTFAEAGGPAAYFGAPQAGSAAEGEATYAVMARLIVDAVKRALPSS